MIGQDDWNLAHVINSISATGSIPPDRIGETKDILNAVLSDLINNKRDLDNCRKGYQAATAMHSKMMVAMSNNDLLRARTLIVDWSLKYVGRVDP